MKKAGILGFASWFPETIRRNNEWPQTFIDNFTSRGVSEDLNTFVNLRVEDTDNAMVIRYLQAEMGDPFFGTKHRRIAPDTMTSVEAETLAANAVLKKTGIKGGDISVVMAYSSLPDRIMPSSANAVAANVGATQAHCIGIDTACASTLSQIILAQSLIESGQAKYVLLVQSHVVLRGWPILHPASPNVGDSATAMVMGPSDKHTIAGSYAVSHGEHYETVTYTRGKKEDVAWWLPGDKGFYLGSHDSVKAKALIMNTINAGKDTIQRAINSSDHAVSDIGVVVSVQPRKWVPEGIARALSLPATTAVQTFEEYAHLGPCGIIANLEEADKKSMLNSGTVVAMYAQGAGFCRASVIVEW